MTKYIEKAQKLVEVINSQLTDGEKVTMEDCYKGIFPWQSAYIGNDSKTLLQSQ